VGVREQRLICRCKKQPEQRGGRAGDRSEREIRQSQRTAGGRSCRFRNRLTGRGLVYLEAEFYWFAVEAARAARRAKCWLRPDPPLSGAGCRSGRPGRGQAPGL